jgi:hypothetical protein
MFKNGGGAAFTGGIIMYKLMLLAFLGLKTRPKALNTLKQLLL